MMTSSPDNFSDYFKEIEAEIEALKATIRRNEAAARPQPPAAHISRIGDTPIMQFTGPVEPFTLRSGNSRSSKPARAKCRAF